jgi:hypothetical protein
MVHHLKSASKRQSAMVRAPRKPGLGVRLTAEVRTALERAAYDQHRSLSNVIEVALIEWLERNGYLERRESGAVAGVGTEVQKRH